MAMLALTTVLLTMTASDASMAYVKVTLYPSGTCEGTASGYLSHGVTDVCQASTGSGGYVMISCNSTHSNTQTYTDNECKTKSTASSSSQDLECNASISDQRTIDCSATSNAAIMMMFSDSTCTDTNFAGFRYYSMDVCFGSSSYYKYECDTSDKKKLIKQYYSDNECTTKETNSSMTQTFSTETCVDSSTNYYELYSGCGETGTLPTGVTAPVDSNTGAGQVSGSKVALASFPLLAAVMIVAK